MIKKLFGLKDTKQANSSLSPGKQSTQEWLPIYDVTNRLMYRRDGFIVAGVIVQPLNLHLLSEKEQAAKISSFHEVLNGIDYEYQKMVLPRPVDLDGYIANLTEKQNNEEHFLKKRLLDGYIRQAAMLATGGQALEPQFYFFLPFELGKKENISENELLARATELAANLTSAGLTSDVCNDQELRDVLFVFTSPQQAAYERSPLSSGETFSTIYEGGK
jgi:hypothetical protein